MRIFVLFILTAAGAFASGITTFYSGSYSINSLGAVAGASGYGAILFEQGNNNVLLLAGNADYSSGLIDAVTLTRGPDGHITGFSSVVQYSTAPYIDGGLAYAPNGDLLFTQYGGTGIGQIKPGSTSPDKTVSSPAGSGGGSLGFVPSGMPGAGNFVTASYGASRFCVSALTADGSGTYNVAGCATPESISGPAVAVWVAAGSPLFSSASVLVGRTGTVYAYTLDANGLPSPSSANAFLTVPGIATGMAVDPLTGDLVVAATSPDQLFLVKGFNASAASIPEPGSLVAVTIGIALIALGCWRRRT